MWSPEFQGASNRDKVCTFDASVLTVRNRIEMPSLRRSLTRKVGGDVLYVLYFRQDLGIEGQLSNDRITASAPSGMTMLDTPGPPCGHCPSSLSDTLAKVNPLQSKPSAAMEHEALRRPWEGRGGCAC